MSVNFTEIVHVTLNMVSITGTKLGETAVLAIPYQKLIVIILRPICLLKRVPRVSRNMIDVQLRTWTKCTSLSVLQQSTSAKQTVLSCRLMAATIHDSSNIDVIL